MKGRTGTIAMAAPFQLPSSHAENAEKCYSFNSLYMPLVILLHHSLISRVKADETAPLSSFSHAQPAASSPSIPF